MCQTSQDAERGLELARKWLEENGLSLHPEKTRIVDMSKPGGFDFLGYHFERNRRRPSRKSIMRLRDTIRGTTRRTNGNSMESIITAINRVLRGWFEYFKHSYWRTFQPLDSWIRMRLRSILRKRHGGKGRGHGNDHNRWPNAYFAECGLFSLVNALIALRQSS
jgi:RNA-directed DNA polymerase